MRGNGPIPKGLSPCRTSRAVDGPSQRQQRVAELVRHALAEVLSRGDLQDEVLASHVVTIPEVRMSPDLKLATAYVMPLGGKDEEAVIAALDRHKKHPAPRGRPAGEPEIRPRTALPPRPSFDEAARIDALLRSEKVAGTRAARTTEDGQEP